MTTHVNFQLPDWVDSFQNRYRPTTDVHQQMQFVLDAARHNITQASGGPFAAAIIHQSSGQLLSLGVNLVTSENLSPLHAEIVAICLAQRQLGHYDLSHTGEMYQLVSSCEPCAMCLGAIPWSGLRSLVSSARDEDARAIGFDEGLKPDNWQNYFAQRHIHVIGDIERQSGANLLLDYQRKHGELYNTGAAND